MAGFLFTTQSSSLRAYERHSEWAEFAQWMVKFQKSYSNEWELMQRFGIFLANRANIHAHNAKKSNHTKAINHFADLTQLEFKERHLCQLAKAKRPVPSTIN
jgi:hypothetical protein